MADVPPYLPVIKTITRPDGSSFSPVGELRIMPGITATVVTGDGPDRIELALTVVAPVYLPIVPVTQPAVANGQSGPSTGCILAFASLDGPSHFTGAQMFADSGLTASNTDYIEWAMWDVDEASAHVGAALATGSTKLLASGGSGPWTAGRLAIDVGWSGDIATGHRLVVEWDTVTHAATRSNPGGFWRTK